MAESLALKALAPSAILNPLLAPLANNGGATPTHALLSGISVIDKGNSFGLPLDQRGLTRPFDQTTVSNLADGADIGAFEAQAVTMAAGVSISGRVLTSVGRGLVNVRVILTDQNGTSRAVSTTSFGYFNFEEVQFGKTVIITVVSKRY